MSGIFGSLGVLFALFMIFSFQNCSQPGDISKVQGDTLAAAMEIIPVGAEGNEVPGEDFLPTPSGDLFPTTPVTGTHNDPVGPDRPGQTTASNQSGPRPSDHPIGSTNQPHHSAEGGSGGGSGGGYGGDSSGDSDCDDHGDDHETTGSFQKVDSCRSMRSAISDFKLSVASLEISQANGNKVQIETLNSFISSESNQLQIKVNENLSLDKINIVLNQNGNHLLFKDGALAELRTPSAQQSGIKVQLSSRVSLEAGKTYILTLGLDLGDQIVASGNKCLFRPVIHTGKLVLSN